MTTQEAKICPTCQFVATNDQDHGCLDYLRKVNERLIAELATLSDTPSDEVSASDSPDRVSDFGNALHYILDAKNTEGDCYEFVARLKAKADTALRKWGQIT